MSEQFRATSNLTVVITAAGAGRRFGGKLPKTLLTCAGRSLLEWQLALCRDVAQVVVVTGFQSEQVGAIAKRARPDVTVIENPRWESTRAGASVAVGATVAKFDRVAILDGDVLVHPRDWEEVLSSEVPFVGVVDAQSRDAVYVCEDESGEIVRAFSRDSKIGRREWGCVCLAKRTDWLNASDGHIFETLEGLLPMPSLFLRTVEIDYPEDLVRAQEFANEFLVPAFNGR